ncbi:MAG: dimethylsulfonioproprionate lyase family protein [Pseudomonadota bacterium]
MNVHPTLHALRAALRGYAQTQAPDIDAFCGDLMAADHAQETLPAHQLPGAVELQANPPKAAPATQSLLDAILAAAPHVQWRQSYTNADDGIDANHLNHYAWFNLIAPSGPFVSTDLRVSVGYWGRGLTYPRHRHEPEEIYLTVAGCATYTSEGRAPVVGGPGTTICHYSNQPHAATFFDAPLLAAAFWRGHGLEDKSVIGRDV